MLTRPNLGESTLNIESGSMQVAFSCLKERGRDRLRFPKSRTTPIKPLGFLLETVGLLNHRLTGTSRVTFRRILVEILPVNKHPSSKFVRVSNLEFSGVTSNIYSLFHRFCTDHVLVKCSIISL